jgi:hypothetical protein
MVQSSAGVQPLFFSFLRTLHYKIVSELRMANRDQELRIMMCQRINTIMNHDHFVKITVIQYFQTKIEYNSFNIVHIKIADIIHDDSGVSFPRSKRLRGASLEKTPPMPPVAATLTSRFKLDDSEEEVSVPRRIRKTSVCDSSTSKTDEPTSYALDKRPLVRHIVNSLFVSLGSLVGKQKLEASVKEAIETANEAFIDAYCSAKPADKSWRVGLPSSKITKLEPVLQTLRKRQEKENITLDMILSAALPESDKLSALEIYDILQNTEPYTEEHRRLRHVLRDIFSSQLTGASSAEISTFDAEEARLESLSGSTRSENFREKIVLLEAPDVIKAVVMSKYRVFITMDKDSSSYSSMYEWLDWAISLPWHKCSPRVTFSNSSQLRVHLREVRDRMDLRIYGLNKVKDKLLAHYCSRLRGGKSAILGLKGSAGIGKTSLICAYADAIGIPFEHISMGGAIDPTVFRGDRAAWVGSNPGVFVHALRKARVKNCVILLDEIDKVGKCAREGDTRAALVEAALLHATDRSQNSKMKDDFLAGLEIDVSQVDQFFTMNDALCINPILLDRIEIVEILDYTPKEKIAILKMYSLPRFLKDLCVSEITLTDSGAKAILSRTKRSTGMRNAEKILRSLIEKVAMFCDLGDKIGDVDAVLPYTITESTVSNLCDTENIEE